MSVTIINGDCREVILTVPDNSIDCCVTSPPYYGLRDYGVDGQMGLEKTLDEYLGGMVELFREVRRVLKPEGTFWLNIGDSYSNAGTRQGDIGGSVSNNKTNKHRMPMGGYKPRVDGMKNKDLCMVPNRLAIRLQEDGWYVRSEIIWHKPNPMPESVRDRPTSAHEKVWLLTKSDKYFYDADAIKENADPSRVGKGLEFTTVQADAIGRKPSGNQLPENYSKPRGAFKNARNVWSITPKPFKGAHFATMPPDLAERCIKAGCPEGGTVLDPFGGAGTTAIAAIRNKRKATLIELNNEYSEIAQERIRLEAPLFMI